jgi:WD40 repeat protein
MSFPLQARHGFPLWRPTIACLVSAWILFLLGGAAAGQEALVLKGHIRPDHAPPRLDAIAYSPDGRLLASGGLTEDRLIVWDAATSEKVWAFDNDFGMHGFAFSPDGRSLAVSFSEDGTKLLVLYEVATWKERLRVTMEQRAEDLVFSPDGQLLAWREKTTDVAFVRLGLAGEQKPTVLDMQDTREAYRRKFFFSPDSKQLIVGYGNGDLCYYDYSSGKEVVHRSAGNHLRGLALSPDGKTLIVLGDSYPNERSGVVQLRDFPTGRWRKSIVTPTAQNTYFLAAASKENVLVTAGGNCLSIFKGRDAELWATRFMREGVGIKAVSISPDGKRVATANSDGTVSLFDVPKEKEEIKPRVKD